MLNNILRCIVASLVALSAGCRSDAGEGGVARASCLDRTREGKTALASTLDLEQHEFSGGFTRLTDGFAGLDLRSGHVVLLDSSGSPRGGFGRTGDGPLELQAYAGSQRLRTWDAHWIDAREDRLVVFDGRQLLIGDTGGFRHSVRVPRSIVSGLNQVHQIRWLDAEHVLLAFEQAPEWNATGDDNGSFRVVILNQSDGRMTEARRFPSRPWSRNAAGRLVRGVADAHPHVAVYGTCFVYSDGHSDSLFVADGAGGASVVYAVKLPKQFAKDLSVDEYRRLGIPEHAIVKPRYPARISGLAVDEQGRVWIWPSAPRFSDEAWRLEVGRQAVMSDTLSTSMAVLLRAQ